MDFLLDNIIYVALAAISGAMLLWPMVRPTGGVAAVSTLDATMRINKHDATVIDLRTAEQYAQGHLPRARNVPLSELAARVGELERLKSKPVILVGDDIRVAGAAKTLKQHGFDNVAVLEGGVAAWRKAELPLER